jgi:secreted trypsin-like serine protease
MSWRFTSLIAVLALFACGPAEDQTSADPTSETEQTIVAGTTVPQSQLNSRFPWMLAFGHQDLKWWDAGQNGVWCGAVLVSAQWAITSGHCVLEDYRDPTVFTPLSNLKVARATVFSSKMSDTINDTTTFGVTKVILHPWYSPNYAPDYDIALIKLSASVPGPYASLETTSTGANVMGTIIGWGSTIAQNADSDPSNSPQDWKDQLRQAPMKTISNVDCTAAYRIDDAATNLKETDYTITPRMICATGVGLGVGGKTSGSCFADSGGPLLVSSGGQLRVTGLTSSGANCAQNAYPDTYQRVTGSIGKWIRDCQIKPNGGDCTLVH